MRVVSPLIAAVAVLVAVAAVYRGELLARRVTQLEQTVPAPAKSDDGAPSEPLTERVASLETAVKTLSESFFGQANDVASLKQDRDRVRKARLDLDNKTFARLDTQLGPLFVQAEAVRRRPEDTTVDLLIGNPTSATLVETTLHARWGKSYEPPTDFQLWQDGLKEKDFTIKDALRPGAWNRYALHLDTGPVTLLGFLEISFDAKTVQMLEVTSTTTSTLRSSTTTTRPPDEPRDAGPSEKAAPEPEHEVEPEAGVDLDPPAASKPVSKPAAPPSDTAPPAAKPAAAKPGAALPRPASKSAAGSGAAPTPRAARPAPSL